MTTTHNYHLPPEWAPQSGVMLTWPRAQSDWGPYLESVEPVFVAIAQAVTRFEKVLIACNDDALLVRVKGLLNAAHVDMQRVILAVAPSNDTWARDHGPITALDHEGNLAVLDFEFNGWGGKYKADKDNQISSAFHGQGIFGHTKHIIPGMVLEGGSIEVDGDGTLLTTESCLLTDTRNPGMSKSDIEHALTRWLGVKRFLWLKHGHLEGDDTDGHIDTLARFCDAHTIAYVRCTDPTDPHFAELDAMEKEIQALRRANGEPYRLAPLPWPRAVTNDEGDRLPATYANFLIINGAVLVPTYNDPHDAEALATLKECFPDREIIGVPSRPLVYQFGSLHCVTMQLPAGLI